VGCGGSGFAGLSNNGSGTEGFLLGKAGGADFSTLGKSTNAVDSCGGILYWDIKCDIISKK
jgi:hypothetical protein